LNALKNPVVLLLLGTGHAGDFRGWYPLVCAQVTNVAGGMAIGTDRVAIVAIGAAFSGGKWQLLWSEQGKPVMVRVEKECDC
jgi:hypothetical protein